METIVGRGSYSFSRKSFLLAKVIHLMKPLPVVEGTTFSGSHFFSRSCLLYQKLFVLVENALFSRNYSFQWKPLFLVETIGLQQYSFHLVETVPFNGRHFLHWKLFLLLEAIHFSENHSFQWKPFPVVEAIPFRESLCFSWKSLPHFFSGSCSF